MNFSNDFTANSSSGKHNIHAGKVKFNQEFIEKVVNVEAPNRKDLLATTISKMEYRAILWLMVRNQNLSRRNTFTLQIPHPPLNQLGAPETFLI